MPPRDYRLWYDRARTSRMKLSIVMPAYNEARTIGTIVPRVLGVDIGAMERELIIIDDGSTDGTRDILAGFKDPRIRVLLQPANRGNGAAVWRGMLAATGDRVILQVADPAHE